MIIMITNPQSTTNVHIHHFDGKNPPTPGGFPIYYVPLSRTVSKRTPLEEFVPGASRGVLLSRFLMRANIK